MKSSCANKSSSASTTPRPAHLAKSRTPGNGINSATRHPGTRAPGRAKGGTTQTSAAAPKQESGGVKYTVIITNVENDFGKLHRACLPHYCGLRSDYEETMDVERLINEGGPQTRRLNAAVHGCSYAVRCRTETRSAEISLYGPANADFAPMQVRKASRRSSTPTKTSAKADEKETSASPVLFSEATTMASIAAVEQLALRLRRQHYFEEKLAVSVHLPGRTADEVLLRIDEDCTPKDALVSEEERNAPEEDEHADAQGNRNSAGEKRQRSSDGATPSLQRAKAEAPTEEVAARTDDSMIRKCEGAAKNESDLSPSSNGRKSRRLKSKSTALITQFPRRQKDFVTAVAALSLRVPLQRVRGRLRDLPGYLSCWSLYDRHLRVVFRDAESLFKAKQLLDQFELENGLRVSLLLSDALSRTNAEFVRAQENETVNE